MVVEIDPTLVGAVVRLAEILERIEEDIHSIRVILEKKEEEKKGEEKEVPASKKQVKYILNLIDQVAMKKNISRGKIHQQMINKFGKGFLEMDKRTASKVIDWLQGELK